MDTRVTATFVAFLALSPAPGAAVQEGPDGSALAELQEAYQQQVEEFEASLDWRVGTVEIGDGLATLEIPEDFRFLGSEDAQRVLVDAWGNPPGEPPLGMIVPAGLSLMSDEGWAAVVTWEEDGYVEDDEARTLDYQALLKEMQDDTRRESEARMDAGYEAIQLIGWAEPPHYDEADHKLYWAQDLRFGDAKDRTLNYNVRVLGRRGVLVLNAVAAMGQLDVVREDMETVMGFVAFNDGHRYDDYVTGDRVAAYGIGALIAGKVAAKAGLFKVLLAMLVAGKKFVAVGVLGMVAVGRRVFGRGDTAGA